jgi:hypothetical protein
VSVVVTEESDLDRKSLPDNVGFVVEAVIRPSDQIMINMSPLYMDSSVHTSKFLIRLKTLTYIRLFGGDAISMRTPVPQCPRHYVVTYPSSTPWIKLRTEHLRLRAIIEEGRP